MAKNLAELFDAFAPVFNRGQTRLRLYGVHVPGELPPADVSAYLRTVGRRLDLRVTVAGYGVGRLAVVRL